MAAEVKAAAKMAMAEEVVADRVGAGSPAARRGKASQVA